MPGEWKRRWTRDFIQRIERMYIMGLPSSVIAERLDVPPDLLRTVWWRYKHGHLKFKGDDWLKERQLRERMFMSGMSIAAIARARGVSSPAIAYSLSSIGLDAEERRAMRRRVVDGKRNALKGQMELPL